jgi:hypothetical protein
MAEFIFRFFKVLNFGALILLCCFPILGFGQYSKTKISWPFTYKGNSSIKLTEDCSRQLLICDLTRGAYLSSQNSSCRSCKYPLFQTVKTVDIGLLSTFSFHSIGVKFPKDS